MSKALLIPRDFAALKKSISGERIVFAGNYGDTLLKPYSILRAQSKSLTSRSNYSPYSLAEKSRRLDREIATRGFRDVAAKGASNNRQNAVDEIQRFDEQSYRTLALTEKGEHPLERE